MFPVWLGLRDPPACGRCSLVM